MGVEVDVRVVIAVAVTLGEGADERVRVGDAPKEEDSWALGEDDTVDEADEESAAVTDAVGEREQPAREIKRPVTTKDGL